MELRQLQHFVAVAEERHFTRAAQRVNIVQSALSASIRALEEELDARLFVRSTRQVRLTDAGRVFLDKARAALDAVREARGAVEAVKGVARGTLGIGTVQSLPAFLDLPALLARFHARHPGVEVRLCQGGSSHLLDKVKGGGLDLAFLPLGEPPPHGVTATMIACDALVVACAPGHPLAGRADLELGELKDEPFVDFQPDWGTRRLVDRAFREAGVERRTAFEVSDLDTLLQLTARGLGVALIPEAIAGARAPVPGVARLAGPDICWELAVAYRSADGLHASPAETTSQAFLSLMEEAGMMDRGEETIAEAAPAGP